MDPTVSTEAFRDPHTNEQLAGEPYGPERNLEATCDLVGRLAAEGLFEATVYDDLFRASLTAAWHALRHADKDEQFTSYEAQVDYYTKMINANPQWDFVCADTGGRTGTHLSAVDRIRAGGHSTVVNRYS